MSRSHIVRVMATACLVAVVLAACGSGSHGTTTTGTTTSNATGVATAAPTSAELAARLKLARCLRSNGIQVPDPSAGGAPRGTLGNLLRSLTNEYGPTKLQAAINACRQYVASSFPRLALTPSAQAQRQQELLTFAKCMRAHGVDVPDPQPGVAGGLALGRALSQAAQSAPGFRSAAGTCAAALGVRLPAAAG